MSTSNKLIRHKHNNQHKQKNPASVRYQDTKYLHEKRPMRRENPPVKIFHYRIIGLSNLL